MKKYTGDAVWVVILVAWVLISLGIPNGTTVTTRAQQISPITAPVGPAPTPSSAPASTPPFSQSPNRGLTPVQVIIGVAFIIGSILLLNLSREAKNFTTNQRVFLLLVSGALVFTGGYLLVKADYSYDWIGLGDFTDPGGEFERNKTLWDWMKLLLVPIILALIGFRFNDSRSRTEREIAENRLQQDALQTYIDRMAKLLFENKLRESQEGNEVREIAQALTRVVLRRLNGPRKGLLVQFLYKSDLIKVKPGLEGTIVNLKDADLKEADLSENNLNRANLSETDLTRANLFQTELHSANLREAKLGQVTLSEAYMFEAHLDGATLVEADLFGANLSRATLTNTNLREANLDEANLSEADLSGATLTKAQLRNADLTKAILRKAVLTEADLSNRTLFIDAILIEADLRKANLRKAVLRGADLSGADLNKTDLRGADLAKANLTEVDLVGARVSENQLVEAKSLKGAILPDGTRYAGR